MTNPGSVSVLQLPNIRKAVSRLLFGFLVGIGFCGMALAQTDALPLRIDGDIGLGSYYTRSIIRGHTDHAQILPYGNFDYGRMFMRIDTLGIKTFNLGYGYLEIAARFSQDGFNAGVDNLHGIGDRQTSIPLGLGTLQITPIGAFFINAFHDINKSGGNLSEVIYVAELDTPRVVFYPMAGGEYQSSNYVRYYYGISAWEASLSQYPAYQPNDAFNPLLGLMIDAKLTREYHLDFYLRRKWLGNAIQSSPIVGQRTMDTGFVALSYRFE
ncbi:MAG TPA: MipA/OmpV family protein [Gallionella sp.]|nr:MipA/OmpV family protein [Gallionella sp.]